MAKKRYEADYVLNLNKTITSLKNAKEQAEQFDDIMSSIGDRGNLNNLIKYFVKLDDMVDSLRQSTNELMSGLGDSLKDGYIASLDGVFDKLAVITKVSQNVFGGLDKIDLNDKNAGKQLKQYATQLNLIFDSLQIADKIDLDALGTKSLEKQLQTIVGYAKTLNQELHTSFGNIDASGIVDEAGKAMNDAVKEQIDALEAQKKKYEEVVDTINKKQLKIKTTKKNDVEELNKLIEAYRLAEQEVKRFETAKDTSGDGYKKALAEQARLANLLKNTMDYIAESGSDAGVNLVNKHVGDTEVYGRAEKFLKIFYQNSSETIGKIKSLYQGLITGVESEIAKLNQPTSGTGVGGGGVGVGIDLSAMLETLNDVSDKLREIDALSKSLDDPDIDYDEVSNRIDELKNEFIELYKIASEELNGIDDDGTPINFLENLGYSEETTRKAIEHFQKLILLKKGLGSIGDGDSSGGTGTGTGHGTGVVDADQLKKDLAQIHELSLKTGKELSFSISANGVEYVVESMEGMVKISDEAATAVNSLNNGLTVLAHSHPGGNGYFSAGDFTSAINAKSVGVNSPIVALGKDMASVLNLDGVTDEILAKVKAKLGSLSGDDVISPKLFQEIRQIFESGGFADALNTFNISDGVDGLSDYLKKIGENATESITPLEKFQSLIMYYSDGKVNKNNLSSFGSFWDDFTSGARTALEIFDAIMDKVGAVDTDGNPLKINTDGYKSLAVAAKNITVGDNGGSGSGDGEGVDDEEIAKAEKLRDIIREIKQAVEDKTEAFRQENEAVSSYAQEEVNALKPLYDRVNDIEEKFNNIINLDVKSLDFDHWITQLGDVLDALEKINTDFTNINSVLGSLNTNFNDIAGQSASGDTKQAQVENMKVALTQLLKTVTDHNNQTIGKKHTDQELSAQFLSNGSIVLGHGENGTVPWNVSIEAILSDLLHPLIMDTHSHPWGEFMDSFHNSKIFSNDTFSGHTGDLAAFRTSRKFGAKLASMITGNVLHVFDIGKLAPDIHDIFVGHLKNIAMEYSQDPTYSKYVGLNSNGGRYLKSQNNLNEWHTEMAVFKQMMTDALARAGLSDSEIQEVYKEYNLKDDAQLTSLATTLVELSNAATKASSPIDRLKELLIAIGTSKIKREASSAISKAFLDNDKSAYEEAKRQIRLYAGNAYDSELADIDSIVADKGVNHYSVSNALRKIIDTFGTDIESKLGETALESLRKGERSVADVFNDFQNIYPKVSQETIDSLIKIDPGAQDSKEVQTLSSILSALNSIDSNVSNIVANTQRTLAEEFNAAANALVYTAGGEGAFGTNDHKNYLTRGYESAVDKGNVTEYKAKELYQAADAAFDEFDDNLTALFRRFKRFDEVDPSKIKVLLDNFGLAISRVDDAKIQTKLYEDRYGSTVTHGGSEVTGKLDNLASRLVNDDTINKLLALVKNAQFVVEDNMKFGRLSNSTVDDNFIDRHQYDDGDDENSIVNVLLDIFNVITSIDAHISSRYASTYNNTQSSYQDTSSSVRDVLTGANVDITSEISQLNQLVGTLSSVIRMINAKTEAFKLEASTVDSVVQQEIEALIRLETYLSSVKVSVESLLDTTKMSNVTFDSWIQDLSTIETNVKNILDYFASIESTILRTNSALDVTTTKDIKNIRDNNGDNKMQKNINVSLDTSSETQQLDSLKSTLNDVINAINEKTNAFKNESDVVDSVIAQEIATLNKLETYLRTLKTLIDSLGNIQISNIDLSAWNQNLSIIEVNVKKILDYFIGIQNAVSGTNFNGTNPINNGGSGTTPAPAPVPSGNNGKYALDTTLHDTNSILELIFDAITDGDNNDLATALQDATKELRDVANGIVQHQTAQKKDTREASDRIADLATHRQISDIARNKAIGLSPSGEVEIDQLTALKNGVVKVTGAFKDANDVWQSFSVKVNQANEAVDFGTQKQSAFAKALNEANKATPGGTSKKGSSIKSIQDKFYALSGRAESYTSDTANIYSSTVKAKLQDYENALNDLKQAQEELTKNTQNLSQEKLDENFARAKDECNKYARELAKLMDAHDRFKQTHSDAIDVDRDEYNIDDINDQRKALEDFVNSVYGADAKIGKFNDSNSTLQFTVKNTDGSLRRLVASFDATKTAIGSAADKTKEASNLFDKIGVKAGQLFTYLSARFGIDELFQQFRRGIEYVREIDSALTELKKVTNETGAAYNRFLQDMSKTAGVIGSSVSELVTMSAEWARLGYSMEEAGKLAESTAILLNVSEFKDATEASEALISTMQAFEYLPEQSKHVVDILNEVGNNFAVSSSGLAVALQDSASALVEGGNSLEQAVALIASANKVVQDPNSVGSALRTISLRLRGTSVEVLEEMGEETEGVVESTSKLQAKLKALTGVDILTDTGAYKDTYTILQEIGNEWDNITDIDKAATLELMAGKNRANTLAAILTNMEDLEDAYKSAMDAEGSALRENEAYLDSIQGRIDLFTNALQTFWMNAVNSSVIKGVVDAGTDIINLLDTVQGKILAIVGGIALYERIKNKVKFSEMFDGVVKTGTQAVSMIKSAVTGVTTLTATTFKQTLAAQVNDKATRRQIISQAGLTTVTGTLTKAQIKETAETLMAAYADGKLTTSQYIATMSTLGLKNAFIALGDVIKKHPIYAIAAATAVAALALDKFTTTAQEASEAAQDAFNQIQNVIKSTDSEIQSLKSELEDIQGQIDALDGKKLSFAEDQELKRLEKQKEELEHSKKIQEQLLELQQKSSNEKAVAAMKAYTKASSQGAKETQNNWKKALTTIGAVAGAGLAIALAVPTGGTSLIAGGTAIGASIGAAGIGGIAAGGIAGGLIGDKAGEWIGSSVAENDGTYDAWYETYKRAFEEAAKARDKAWKESNENPGDLDKFNEYQEAKQEFEDIESEMYGHISQLQQYRNTLEYGMGHDEELKAFDNFLDKFYIEQGASGAEQTALDRIFGENASDEIKLIEKQILNALKTGEEFDFESAINGSKELSDTLAYIGLETEDVKNYFTQVGEAIAAGAREITSFKSYASLTDDVAKYNDVLLQSNEILAEGVLASEDYYNALVDLGISETELSTCIDKNNGYMVTNVDLLNDLIEGTKDDIAANVKLAKGQSRLKYYDLYKQMRTLTKEQKQLTGAALDEVNALHQQMGSIEKTIAKYSILEAQLLGTTNAFDQLAAAQAADEAMDYGTKAEELVNVLANAFNTAELGTEAAQVAISGLIPPEVFEDADTLDEKMQKIYEYFTSGNISKLFTIEFDADGNISSVEMSKKNVENYVNELLNTQLPDGMGDGTIFQGTWDEFSLNPAITSMEQLEEATGHTSEVLFAFLTSLEKYDIGWLGEDYSTLLDQLMGNDLDYQLQNKMQKIADLEHKMANEGLNEDEQKTYGNLVGDMEALEEQAYSNVARYAELSNKLNETKQNMVDMNKQLAETEEGTVAYETLRNNINSAQKEVSDLITELDGLGEVTEFTVQVALDEAQEQIDEFKSGITDTEINAVIKNIDDKGLEKLGLTQNSDGSWSGLANIKGYSQLDQASQQKVVDYINLLNSKHTIDAMAGEGILTVEEHLKDIVTILENTYELIIGVEDSELVTWWKEFSSAPLTKKVSMVADWIFGGDAEVNGTAHARGTAFAGGKWGASKTETALVGELGPEMVVRGNRWFTVGDNGAEFTDVKKGDIIFNHKQTKDLLSKGHVSGRGKAYASGTAYAFERGSGAAGSLLNKYDEDKRKATVLEKRLNDLDGKVADTSIISQKTRDDLTQTKNAIYNAESIINTWADAYDRLSKEYGNTGVGSGSGQNDSKQLIDFVETKLENIEATISKTTAYLNNYVDDTSAESDKLAQYNKLVSEEKKKKNTYSDAESYYSKKAEELLKKVNSKYREMAQNGAIAIEDFIGDKEGKQAEAIQEYREMVNKANEAKVAELESIARIEEIRLEQFNDLADDYDNVISLITAESDLINAHMDLQEAKGERLSENYYTELIKNTNETIDELEDKRARMQKDLANAVSSGDVEKGSDTWYEMVNAIIDVDEELIQCEIDVEEFQNSINDLKWDNLDKLIDRFDSLDSELSHVYERLTDGKVVNDDGTWNDKGIAALGVAAQQMELAQAKAEQYDKAINDLNKDYKKGLYSTDEYNEKLAELKENQWESIEAYEDAKDAIVDLNKTRIEAVKDGIEKEIDAYKELIDKKKEALDADKDLYDFEKNVAKQQKDIATIERKLAALSGDNSISAAAQRKQLDAELAEAKAELNDTYRDRSIDQQKEALDKEAENFEEAKNTEMEALDKWLENEETVISESINTVKSNTDIVLQEIKGLSSQYGIDISNSITQPWKDGSKAIDNYKGKFSELSSSFKDAVDAIVKEQERLNKEADKKAGDALNAALQAIQNKKNAGSSGGGAGNGSGGGSGNDPASNSLSGSVSGVKQVLNRGDTGEDVKALQTALNKEGYSLDVDGSFGPATEAAVKDYQSKNGLSADGLVGPQTKGELKKDGYAKGTLGVKESDWAWIDEIGEELVLHADGSGKLSYLTKGSSVIPADLTEKLMKLAVDPTQTLEASRPVVSAPHITNNEINISMDIAEVVHIDTVTNDTLPDLTKAVEKQMDKYMKNLNNQIRKYTR